MNNVDHLSKKLSPKISVIGVGGAGGNAVNNMISTNLNGVDFVVCNTDSQALISSLAEHKVQLGTALTEGLGAGAKPEIGRGAAEESLDDVMQYLEDANMAFITAGMGGGTGTGAASVIAKACRERGILTVGVVTKPFHFEGSHRMRLAEEGISEMQNYVDTLIVIPNQNLFRVVNDKTTFSEAFKMADSVLQSAVRGVTDLIVVPGLINLDFADIRSVMQEMGKAVMGTGEATGDNRAIEAAEKAISNPLLDDVSMKGAKGVIVNITGGYDMTLFEVDEACNRIRDEVDPNANIIFGSSFDESMEGKIRVSVVATGIDAAAAEKKTTRTGGSGTLGGFVSDRLRTRQSEASQITSTPVRAFSGILSSSSAQENQVQRQQQVAAAPVQQQPAYQESAAPATQFDYATQNAAARGTRMGEAFIPPQPVMAQGGYAQQQAAQAVQAPVYQPQQAPATQAPAQHYAPAYEEAQAPARRKSPSLFERITGGYRRYSGSDDFGNEAAQPVQTESAPSLRAQPRMAQAAPAVSAPAQGRLNIDAPAAPKSEEEELDIPAFLRRQTS